MNLLKIFRYRIYLALGLIVLVLTTGILGYRFITAFSWLDALYMTVITVTTVGFSEVVPLSTEAKFFTVFLIISSVFIFAFSISLITEYILSSNSLQLIKKKKVKERINKLSNHVVLCGFGRNGMQGGRTFNDL